MERACIAIDSPARCYTRRSGHGAERLFARTSTWRKGMSSRYAISKGIRIRQAVATLFEGFKSSTGPEKAWARRLLAHPNPTDEDIYQEIVQAIERHCPNVPGDFLPFVVDLLTAAIRLARRDEGLDLKLATPPL